MSTIKEGHPQQSSEGREVMGATELHSSSQQELLQAYMQLQERYHRCTEALASAAHDLKTPLAILSGYIELLQNEKLGPLSERQRAILFVRRDVRSPACSRPTRGSLSRIRHSRVRPPLLGATRMRLLATPRHSSIRPICSVPTVRRANR